MKEVWKPVVGYEGLYEVSNLGRVKSLDRKVLVRNKRVGNFFVFRTSKIMAQRQTGKYMVCALNNGVQKNKLVHRLVAQAFIPNPKNKPCVNHIDFDGTNNKTTNLEWVTYQENIDHAHPHMERGEKRYNSKLTKKQVLEIRTRYSNGGETYRSLAKEYGVVKNSIRQIIKRIKWKHI